MLMRKPREEEEHNFAKERGENVIAASHLLCSSGSETLRPAHFVVVGVEKEGGGEIRIQGSSTT